MELKPNPEAKNSALRKVPECQRIEFFGPVTYITAAFLILIGLTLCAWRYVHEGTVLRQSLLDDAIKVAGSLEPHLWDSLSGQRSDADLVSYQRLKANLIQLHLFYPEFRYIHLFLRHPDGTIAFAIDDQPKESPDYIPPGDVFIEVPPSLELTFADLQARVDGPLQDRWGDWISAFVPLTTTSREEHPQVVLGVDFDASNFQAARWNAMQTPALVGVIFLLVFLIANFFITRFFRSLPPGQTCQLCWATLMLGISLTTALTWRAVLLENQNRSSAFTQLAAGILKGVANNLHQVEHLQFASWDAFIRNNEDLSQESFTSFSSHLTDYSLVDSWGWIKEILPHERVETTTRIRQRDWPDFKFWQVNKDGEKEEVPEDIPVTALIHAAPQSEENMATVGLNFLAETNRRQAMEDARRTGLITATQPIRYVSDASQALGVRIFKPVHRDADRSLLGYVGGLIHWDAVLTQKLTGHTPLRLDIFSVSEDATTALSLINEGRFPSPDGILRYPILVFGQTYLLTAEPTSRFAQLFPARSLYRHASVGLLATLALTLVIRSFAQRQALLAKTVQEKTSELKKKTDDLNRFFVTNPDLLCIVDRKHLFLRVNPEWEASLGYSADALIQKPFIEHISPEDRSTVERFLSDMWSTNQDFLQWEAQMISRHGERRLLEWKASADENHLFMAARDITERSKAENALIAERNFLSRIMGTSISAILVFNQSGEIIFANEEAERLVGLSRSEMENKTYHDPFWLIETIAGEPLPEEDLPFARALREGQPIRGIRHAITRPNGEKRFLSVNADTMEPTPELPGRVVCAIADITDEINAERALIAARNSAEQANQAKSDFLANISHEVRTPLNGIIGMLDLLRETPLNETQTLYTDTVQRSSEALLRIINDILDFAKLEAGKFTLIKEPFSSAILLRQITNLFSPQAAQKGLQFECTFPPNLPTTFWGDKGRLQQILLNLLSNALKFTEQGGFRLLVDWSPGGNPRMVRWIIQDTGPGIPPEKQNLLFQKFSQLDSSLTRQHGGTGLGLAISQALVALMGGQISFRSPLPEDLCQAIGGLDYPRGEVGTEFIFEIPLIEESSQEPPQPIETRKSDQRQLNTAAHSSLPILVVEDNDINRMVIKRLLEKLGYQPLLATQGREAVELLEQNSFFLIFTDIQMPDMDGYDLTKFIRGGNTPNRQTPIIALTANALPTQREKAMECGMNDYLTKPVRLKDLHQVIAKYTSDSD